jgi:polyhydroxybutyrate depolymerase
MIPSLLLLLACTGEAEVPKPVDTPTGDTPAVEVDTPEADTPEADTPDDTPAPCDPSPLVRGDDVELTLMWEGRPRTYWVHLPADYDCTPRAVVVGLHFYTGEALSFERDIARIHDDLNRTGTIGVFPQALGRGPGRDADITAFNDTTSHNDIGPDGATCTDWAVDYGVFDDCGPDEAARSCFWGTSCADDVGLVRAILTDLQQRWTVDAKRIFLTGFSQGGIAAQGWACALQDVIAATAPLHGAAANGYTCGPTSAVSIMDVWGRTDIAINRWEAPSLDGLIYDGAEEAAAVWAEAQGCNANTRAYPTVSDGKQGWGCVEHADCATGATVVQCAWNGTHLWGRDPWNGDFMWDAVWAFFESHPKP